MAYHQPSPFVMLNVEVLVQFFDSLLLHPLLGIRKLANGAVDIELAGTKIASVRRSAYTNSYSERDPYNKVPSS
jgi:hypothetical protein